MAKTDGLAQPGEGAEKPTVDRKTLSALDRAKAKTRKELSRLTTVMKKVKKNKPLENGVGAWGGPIAREVKSPGQHNGLKYEHKNLSSPALNLTEEQMKEITKEHKAILLPVWDHNFTVAGVISKNVERIDDTKDKVYKEEIKKYRTAESGEELAFEVYRSVNMDSSIYLSDNHEIGKLLAQSGAADAEIQRWNECQSKWVTSVRDLHHTASEITYKDLTDVSCLREPPLFAEALVAYIGILLGLPPTWAAAKRSMFHDCFPLMIFLSQVEPLTIPIKRLRAATKLKKLKMRYLSTISCRGVNASRAFRILAGWVLTFNKLARLILEVHRRLKALNYKQIAMSDLPTASMLEDGSLAASAEGIGEGAFSVSKPGLSGAGHGPVMGLESSASLGSPSVELGTSTIMEGSMSIAKGTGEKTDGPNAPRIGVRGTNISFFEQLTNDMSLFDILTSPDEVPMEADDQGEQRTRDGGAIVGAGADADSDAADALASIEAIAKRPFGGPDGRAPPEPETAVMDAPTKSISTILKRTGVKKSTVTISSVNEDDDGYGDEGFEAEEGYGDDFEEPDDTHESHKAATLLQRMHRGRQARKDVETKKKHHRHHGHGKHGKHHDHHTMHFRKYGGSELHQSDMSFGNLNQQHVLDDHKHKFHSDLDHGDKKEVFSKPHVHGGAADPSLKRTYGWKGQVSDKDLDNTLMITYDLHHNVHYHDPQHPDFHTNVVGRHPEVQEAIEEARAALIMQKVARSRVARKKVREKREESKAAVKLQAIQRGRLGRARVKRLTSSEAPTSSISEGKEAEGKQSEGKESESKYEEGKESEGKFSEGKEDKGGSGIEGELARLSFTFSSDAVSSAVTNSPTYAASKKKPRNYSSLAMEEALSPPSSRKMSASSEAGAGEGGNARLSIEPGTPTTKPTPNRERSPSTQLVDSMVSEAMGNVTMTLSPPAGKGESKDADKEQEKEEDDYGDDFED